MWFRCLVFFSVLLLISCDRKPSSTEPTYIPKHSINYISLLGDNQDKIWNSHPLKIKDRLIFKALYNQLISEPNEQHKILDSVLFDSTSLTYTFRINNSTTFSDGELLDAQHVIKQFKYMLDSVREDAIILRFKKNILGYNQYLFSRRYNAREDLLPEGIRILTPSKFSIQLSRQDPHFLDLLNNDHFTIYKVTEDGAYLGTGDFYLRTEAGVTMLTRKLKDTKANKNPALSQVNQIVLNTSVDAKTLTQLLSEGKVDLAHLHFVELRRNYIKKSKYRGLIRKNMSSELKTTVVFVASVDTVNHQEFSQHVANQLLNTGDSMTLLRRNKINPYFKKGYQTFSMPDSSQMDIISKYKIDGLQEGDSVLLAMVKHGLPENPLAWRYNKYTRYFVGVNEFTVNGEYDLENKIEAKIDSLFSKKFVKVVDAYVLEKKFQNEYIFMNYIILNEKERISFSNIQIRSIKELK